jgi:hypothetical protein
MGRYRDFTGYLTPAVGDVFFLDFSFYRTNQDLGATKTVPCQPGSVPERLHPTRHLLPACSPDSALNNIFRPPVVFFAPFPIYLVGAHERPPPLLGTVSTQGQILDLR